MTPHSRAFVEWAINCAPNKGARQLGITAKQFRALQVVLGGVVVSAQLRAEGKPWEHITLKSHRAIKRLPANIQKAIYAGS